MKKVSFLLLVLFSIFSFSILCKETKQNQKYTTFKAVAKYIKKHGRLPNNFITKKEAKRLGWKPSKGNLWKVAPGKSIGGDIFYNREKKLPNKSGRIWYEADINYKGGRRGKYRILFSNDRLIYKTKNHYKTFQRMR